jgi:hypothetical protein
MTDLGRVESFVMQRAPDGHAALRGVYIAASTKATDFSNGNTIIVQRLVGRDLTVEGQFITRQSEGLFIRDMAFDIIGESGIQGSITYRLDLAVDIHGQVTNSIPHIMSIEGALTREVFGQFTRRYIGLEPSRILSIHPAQRLKEKGYLVIAQMWNGTLMATWSPFTSPQNPPQPPRCGPWSPRFFDSIMSPLLGTVNIDCNAASLNVPMIGGQGARLIQEQGLIAIPQ